MSLSVRVSWLCVWRVGWGGLKHACAQGPIVSIYVWLHSGFLPLSTELQRGLIWNWKGSIWLQFQQLTPAVSLPAQYWRWVTEIMQLDFSSWPAVKHYPVCVVHTQTSTKISACINTSVVFICRFSQLMKHIKWNLNLHHPKQKLKKTSMKSSGAFLHALLCFSSWRRIFHLVNT